MKTLIIILFLFFFNISNAQKSVHGSSHMNAISKQSKHEKKHKGHHGNSSNTVVMNRHETFA
jgi:hypothetical protein